MVLLSSRSSVSSSRQSISSTGRPRSSRFARPSSYERPPVVLEWGSWILRVGTIEDQLPKHLITYELPQNLPQTAEEWYSIIKPLVMKCWDRLLFSNFASRRVVIIHPPMMPRAWEAAVSQALWNLGTPAMVFISMLETPPLALEWKCGMIVHIGKTEAFCLAHADGHGLANTLQISPCGYDSAVSDASKVESSWTLKMDEVWLNETNPNSLILAIAKCLITCPTQVRRDVADNIVFCGETVMLVPDIPSRVCDRLMGILKGSASDLPEHPSELTPLPLLWEALTPLKVSPRSTGPYRADMVSWVGACLWVTVWNRHDEDDENIKWTYARTNDEEPGS